MLIVPVFSAPLESIGEIGALLAATPAAAVVDDDVGATLSVDWASSGDGSTHLSLRCKISALVTAPILSISSRDREFLVDYE